MTAKAIASGDTDRHRRFAPQARTLLAPLPEPGPVPWVGSPGGPRQVVLAAPVPVVEEPLSIGLGRSGTPGPSGRQPDHRVGPFGGGAEQRPELGEGGQPAGQPRRVHPAGMGRVAGHTVCPPAAGPLVGQHDLRPLRPRVGRGAAVRPGGHLEAVEVEGLCVHATGRHRHDGGVAGSAQERAEQPGQTERGQHRGGHRELVARRERCGTSGTAHQRRGPAHAAGRGRWPTRVANAATASASTMSSATGSTAAPAPRSRAWWAVASIRSSSRPTSHSVAPRRASSSAAARPMPEEAPGHDHDAPGEIGGRAPVLEARAHGIAGPAEAADDAWPRGRCRRRRRSARPGHANAAPEPGGRPVGHGRRTTRATTGEASRSKPAHRGPPRSGPGSPDRPVRR